MRKNCVKLKFLVDIAMMFKKNFDFFFADKTNTPIMPNLLFGVNRVKHCKKRIDSLIFLFTQ